MMTIPRGLAEPTPEDFARDVWTISRLNREARAVLEGSFPLLWVHGEIASLAEPSSGHLYLTLKDEAAQVRAAMFRPKRRLLGFRPATGQQVLMRGRVALYEARGEFQLLVEYMEPAGEGLWRLELERLKRRLDAEGLFDQARKRPVPAFPRQVGLITSPSGAALHDLLTVLARRCRALPVVVYPVAVQGEGAVEQIVRALELADRRGECDVLILARGGGGYEDLMAFNDERVVRAICALGVAVVTGVGHEIDLTLADLAADRRGATPSAAAELVSPSAEHLRQRLKGLAERLQAVTGRSLLAARQRLASAARHLALLHPAARLRQRAQFVDDLERRLLATMRFRLSGLSLRWREASRTLAARSPALRLAPQRRDLQSLERRLQAAMHRHLAGRRARFAALARGLEALSPLGTLSRGYALVVRQPDGVLLRRALDAPAGTRVGVRLAEGELVCRVESIKAEDT